MNKHIYYENARAILEDEGFIVEDYTEINYGLQFYISMEGKRELLRIYENKKKGARLDPSQIKDTDIVENVQQIIEELSNDDGGADKIKNIQQVLKIDCEQKRRAILNYLIEAGVKEQKCLNEYADHLYKLDGLTITLYSNGKMVIQGKSTPDSVKVSNDISEIMKRKKDQLKKEKTLLSLVEKKSVSENDIMKNNTAPRKVNSIIGIDESGKGDYFGPLVIAAVHVNQKAKTLLKKIGVMDSKKLYDSEIKQLAYMIKKNCKYSVVEIKNKKYNDRYRRHRNLNVLLGQGHAKALENVLNKVDCSYALSDKFGREKYIKNALMEKGKKITLEQRPKAESNIAVAAASILARDAFVSGINNLSVKYKMNLPKGASNKVIKTGKRFVHKYGMDRLNEVAKLHFKTTTKITRKRLFQAV